MKFEIEKNILVNCLKNINSLIDSNSLKPSLACANIKSDGDKLIIVATNGSSCYKQTISNITIKEPGNILVKAKILYSYISKINQDLISINQIDEKILQIKSDSFSCEINLLDDSSFPNIDFSVEGCKKITLTQDTLFNISQKIKPFVSSFFSNSNPATSGILFNPIDERQMECVASDSFRIAYYKFDYVGEGCKFVIDPEQINMALEILSINKNKTIDFYINSKECIISSNNVLVKYSLFPNNYPNIINPILSKQKYSFTVKVKDLLNALERGSVIVLNEQRPIASFKIENKKLFIKYISNETGNSFEEIDLIDSNIDNFEIRLNQKLFLPIVNNIKTEKIIFNFNSSNAPLIISSDNPYFLNLILPIRNL